MRVIQLVVINRLEMNINLVDKVDDKVDDKADE